MKKISPLFRMFRRVSGTPDKTQVCDRQHMYCSWTKAIYPPAFYICVMTKRIFMGIFVVALIATLVSNAQDRHHLSIKKADLPITNLPALSFRNYELLDSFSRVGDSIQASKALSGISPYFLMYLGFDPAMLDSFVNHRCLTAIAAKQYKAAFIRISNTSRTKAWIKFRKYADEDKALRLKRETYEQHDLDTLLRRIEQTDSIHFAYLYNYVNKNGWPKLEDGSLFAADIALHDYGHFEFYFPILMQAFAEGQVPLKDLKKMKKYSESLEGYDSVKVVFDHPHFIFDITSLLRQELIDPQRVMQFLDLVKLHCPIKKVIAITFIASATSPNQHWICESYRMPQKLKTQIDEMMMHKPKELCPAYEMVIDCINLITDIGKEKMVLYVEY
ncbi:MAG: hypothetical protein JSS82_06160 [Bacteroidetes bacterium]|nr:hypothetical protein [Bacteroidota bacterium]